MAVAANTGSKPRLTRDDADGVGRGGDQDRDCRGRSHSEKRKRSGQKGKEFREDIDAGNISSGSDLHREDGQAVKAHAMDKKKEKETAEQGRLRRQQLQQADSAIEVRLEESNRGTNDDTSKGRRRGGTAPDPSNARKVMVRGVNREGLLETTWG